MGRFDFYTEWEVGDVDYSDTLQEGQIDRRGVNRASPVEGARAPEAYIAGLGLRASGFSQQFDARR